MTIDKRQYYPQLDSLRAIAVLLVIVSHWFTQEHFLNRYTANGILGVVLFFVLSGFLITGILLNSKTKYELGAPLGQAFKVFYMRRFLRIFPVYYMLLLLLVFLNVSVIRESFWWHYFYGSNIYFWLRGAFEGSLSHFWSLAVEEQFYIVWPAIILLVSRRYLMPVLITGIITGVLFRLIMVTAASDMGRLLMPASLDSFCIGGLLAYGRKERQHWYKKFLDHQKWIVLFAIVLLVVIHLQILQWTFEPYFTSLYILFISISFGILINRVTYTIETPVVSQILNNSVLLYIGKISYGVYLFHNFIPQLYGLSFPGAPSYISFYLTQLLRFTVLLFVSSLSWFLLEKPILNLKQRFVFQ